MFLNNHINAVIEVIIVLNYELTGSWSNFVFFFTQDFKQNRQIFSLESYFGNFTPAFSIKSVSR